MNLKKLRHLTPDSVTNGGKGTKTGGLSSSSSGDEQAMKRDDEDYGQDDEETQAGQSTGSGQ